MYTLKASPGTYAVKRSTLIGPDSIYQDGLTEQQAILLMDRLNNARRSPTDDLFSAITDTGQGCGPRVTDATFALEHWRKELRESRDD